MSSKSKKRNQARNASPAPNVPTKPETVSAPKEESVTIDDAKKASSQEEFNKIKDKLISGLEGEISTLEDMKKQADGEAQKADENLKQVQSRLDELKKEYRTIILYEAPHHLKNTLSELKEALGGERKTAVCRELTKKFEEVLNMSLEDAVSYFESHGKLTPFR